MTTFKPLLQGRYWAVPVDSPLLRQRKLRWVLLPWDGGDQPPPWDTPGGRLFTLLKEALAEADRLTNLELNQPEEPQ